MAVGTWPAGGKARGSGPSCMHRVPGGSATRGGACLSACLPPQRSLGRRPPQLCLVRRHSRVGAMGACTHSPPDLRRTMVMRIWHEQGKGGGGWGWGRWGGGGGGGRPCAADQHWLSASKQASRQAANGGQAAAGGLQAGSPRVRQQPGGRRCSSGAQTPACAPSLPPGDHPRLW